MPRTTTSIAAFTALAALVLAACNGGGAGSGDTSITITKPADGSMVTESRTTVRGTADGLDEIDVDGEPVGVVGGKWNVEREFDEGPATVTAKGGGAVARSEFTVDSHPPALTVTAPERGRYVTDSGTDQVTVEGRVEDGGTGVRVVSIDGAVVEVADDGTFSHSVSVDEGLTVIEARALDEADNEATVLRGVMVGEVTSPTERIEPGLRLRVGPGALETTETVVENYLTPERVDTLVRQNVESEKFDFQSVDYESLAIDLEPASEAIAVTVTVEGLVVKGDAHLADNTFPVTVTIDETTVTGDLHVTVDENNELVFDLKHSMMQLDPEDFHFALRDQNGNKDEIDEETLRKAAVNVLKKSFSNLIDGALLDRLWDPSVLRRNVEILDRTIVVEVVPKRVDIRGDTIHLQAAFEMPADTFEAVREVPGALDRQLGDWNIADLTSDLKGRTNRTAVERIGHGVWRAGLLHQSLGPKEFEGYDLPVDLNAASLAFALDGRITNLADDETPVGVKLRPHLPPVVAFRGPESDETLDGADAQAGMRLGEFTVDLRLLPTDGDPITIASVALFLDLDVGITLEGYTLTFQFNPDLRADLVAEPEIDFRDGKIEEIVAGLGEAIPKIIGDEMQVSGKEELTWLELEDPRVRVRGENNDQVSMFLDVKPGDL